MHKESGILSESCLTVLELTILRLNMRDKAHGVQERTRSKPKPGQLEVTFTQD
jgi:hypothetical protein